jgi:glc operon protein GlcG
VTEFGLGVAQAVLEAAVAEAQRMDVPMSVAVSDAGGHLLVFARMDRCVIMAAETAPAKARTAVYFRRPTHETVERSQLYPTVYGSFVSVASAPIVLSMGGIPLWDGNGSLVGGVGAAGGTGEQDVEAATAGEHRWLELRGAAG